MSNNSKAIINPPQQLSIDKFVEIGVRGEGNYFFHRLAKYIDKNEENYKY